MAFWGRLFEDDGLGARQQDSVLVEMPTHGAGQEGAFRLAAQILELVHGMGVGDPNYRAVPAARFGRGQAA